MNTNHTLRVWEPAIRFGHWILVIAFFIAYFTEDDFLTQHVWAGYVVGGYVCWRVIWGFVGSKRARFRDFVRSPRHTLGYLRDLSTGRAHRYVGHNPAGAAMVIALLISLSGTVYTGLALYAIEENAGPLAGMIANQGGSSPLNIIFVSSAHADDDGEENEDLEEFWEELHEFFANFTLLLVGLHVAGVLFSSYVHKENLVKAMLTGRKRSEAEE